jgi:hypothetical protein
MSVLQGNGSIRPGILQMSKTLLVETALTTYD